MNLYTYEVLHTSKHQDLLAAAVETQLVKIAWENPTKTNRNVPKVIDDVLQKVGREIVGIYHELYQKSKGVKDLC